ncbi:MAG: DUF2268 domain-containing putative Zn-dependent protease [Sphingomonas sp.]
MRIFLLAALPLFLVPEAPMGKAGPGPEIRTSDVTRFYQLYDAAGGQPEAMVLQTQYIDAGSSGVREFVPYRIVSGENLASVVRATPEPYRQARACVSALPAVKQRLKPAFAKLARLYPEAKFPPVTILIGANNSGGTVGPTGVLIGLEVVCSTVRSGETAEDRLVHLIAHEYAHVEQPEGGPETVLAQSLKEGTAELIAELISGSIANSHLPLWVKGREVAIGEAFLAAKDSKKLSPWLYAGVGTPEKPGDLGYWVGYRIAKSYYDRARNKRAAIRTLLLLEDPEAILRDSGWRPGL